MYVLILYLLTIYRMQIFPNEHQNQPANNINNQRYNPSLINHQDLLIFVIYISITFLLTIFLTPSNEVSVVLLIIMFRGIGMPSIFYCFNGKLRQFYLRKFWENAPNFLQSLNPYNNIEIRVIGPCGSLIEINQHPVKEQY